MGLTRSIPLHVGLSSFVLACTGGPSSWDGLSLGPENAPIAYERPAVSTDDPSGSATGGSDTSSGSNGSNGSNGSGDSDCPPCGTYTCQGSGGTGSPVPFTPQQGGGCGFVSTSVNLVLECGGKITDGKGNTLGSWSASGNGVTLSSSSGPSSTCTVGGSAAPASQTTVDAGG